MKKLRAELKKIRRTSQVFNISFVCSEILDEYKTDEEIAELMMDWKNPNSKNFDCDTRIKEPPWFAYINAVNRIFRDLEEMDVIWPSQEPANIK